MDTHPPADYDLTMKKKKTTRLPATISRVNRLLLVFILLLAAAGAAPLQSADAPPQHPRVTGEYEMTKGWWVTLPGEFARRFEESKHGTDLVLWREGLTCWVTHYNLKAGDTPATTLEWIKQNASTDAAHKIELATGMPLRYAYVLHEKKEGTPERWALYTYTISERGSLLMTFYYDAPAELEVAKKIWMSITEK